MNHMVRKEGGLEWVNLSEASMVPFAYLDRHNCQRMTLILYAVHKYDPFSLKLFLSDLVFNRIFQSLEKQCQCAKIAKNVSF